MTARLKIFTRLLLVLYLVVVFILCFGKFDATPSVPISFLGIPTDKLVHFAMFLPYPALMFFAFPSRKPGRGRRIKALLLILASGILIAVATECVQRFIPYRSGDPFDLAADITGLGLTTLILILAVCLRKD